jgi:hypothetical protein
VKGFNALVHQVLQPLGKMIAQSAKWVWETVVLKAADVIWKGIQTVLNHALKPMGAAIAQGAEWVWNAALVPMAQGVAQAAVALKALVEKVFAATYTSVIVPAGHLVSETARQTADAVVKAAAWTAQAVGL